jgi:hypothetical protein
MSAVAWSIAALRAFPPTLADLVRVIPEQALDWRPPSWEGIPSERLTIRQQLCHLRDIETDGYAVRFARVLNEMNPLLESIDTYALIAPRRYDATRPGEALAAFEDARAKTLHILSGVSATQLARRGRFEFYGDVTLSGLIHYLVSHDQQHLSGIQWLLGQHMSAGP